MQREKKEIYDLFQEIMEKECGQESIILQHRKLEVALAYLGKQSRTRSVFSLNTGRKGQVFSNDNSYMLTRDENISKNSLNILLKEDELEPSNS